MSFHCSDPDFVVFSIPDGVEFHVRQAALQRSEIFRDMFSCCNAPRPSSEKRVELSETSDTLVVLFRLLHDPPPPPTPYAHDEDEEKFITKIRTRKYQPDTVIPWPLLPAMFSLADKYALPESVLDSLRTHLLAHAPTYPLQVYGFATLHGLRQMAGTTSQYIAPLASYTLEEIKVIPTVEAYHKVLQLQDQRVKALRNLLLNEDIFPHGYRECPLHRDVTKDLWDRARNNIVGRIETDTDVAGEMAVLAKTFDSCEDCRRACIAAVEMLAYKCRRIRKRID